MAKRNAPITKKQRKASRRRNIESGKALRQAIQSRGYQGPEMLRRYWA